MPKARNTFAKGVNSDITPKFQPSDTLRNIVNMDIVGGGDFLALTNLKGTTDKGDLSVGIGTYNPLGKFAATANISGVERKVIVHFIKDGDNSLIRLFDTETSTFQTLFSTDDTTDVPALNFPANGSIDAFFNIEEGRDKMYFVDHENNMRFVQLIFPVVQSIDQLLLRPQFPVDDLQYRSDGGKFTKRNGQLFAGTYQFTFRFYDSDNRVFSTWSLLTFPFPVHFGDFSAFNEADFQDFKGGSVGAVINQSILLKISKVGNYSTNYDKYQIGVVKNVDGQDSNALTAFKLGLKDIPSGWGSSVFSINEEYTGFEQEEQISLSDIVVEDAPVKTPKTINQKDNILFGGNVKYNDLLDFDNGTPTFDFAKTIKNQFLSYTAYKRPFHTAGEKGYFREELYRFGITYVDRFGNWSPVQPIDFSGFQQFDDDTRISPNNFSVSVQGSYDSVLNVTTITGATTGDLLAKKWIRFEDSGDNSLGEFRIISVGVGTFDVAGDATSGTIGVADSYVILIGDEGTWTTGDTPDWKFPSRSSPNFTILDSAERINTIGLEISGIQNHPSWAVGFEIVRLERRKNILYQAPHIPTSVYFSFVGAADKETIGTKKIGMGAAKNLIQVSTPPTEAEYFTQVSGGSDNEAIPRIIFLQPPSYMYNTNGTPLLTLSSNASLLSVKIVDGVVLLGDERVAVTDYNTDSAGAYIFKADLRKSYFYTEEGISSIVRDNSDVLIGSRYYDDLHTILGISQSVNIERVFNFTTNQGGIIIDDNGFGNGYYNVWEDILRLQLLEQLALGQGGADPIENQRGIFVRVSEEIQDLTVNIAAELTSGSNRNQYFHLLTWKGTDYIPEEAIDDTYLDQAGTNSFNWPTWNVSGVATPPTAPNTNAASAAFVVNVEAGLSDGRYGDLNKDDTYYSTGSYTPLTEAEVLANTPKTVTVFGGDCFVSRAALKVNNSTLYSDVSNNDIKSYVDNVEIIDMFIESEANAAMYNQDDIYPEIRGTSMATYNKTYDYDYSKSYSVDNKEKIFLGEDVLADAITERPEFIIFSDPEIGLVNENGFSRFRLNNFKKLETQYGGVTKIVKDDKGELYAIQEQAVRYLPVGKELMELQDGNVQTVGGDKVIGDTVSYLTTNNGCQHIRTVVSTQDDIYYFDAEKRQVKTFRNTISRLGLWQFFKDNLLGVTAEKDLSAWYDFNKGEYWINKIDGFTQIWNDRLNVWKTKIEVGSDKILGGVFQNQELYITVNVGSNVETHTFYTGDYDNLFGTLREGSFEVILNQQVDDAKYFDILVVNSDNRLGTFDMTVFNEVPGAPDQVTTGVTLNIDDRQGYYVQNLIRDDVRTGRLVGSYAILTLRTLADGQKVVISNILNQYRKSYPNH